MEEEDTKDAVAEGGGSMDKRMELTQTLLPQEIDDGVRRTGNTFTATSHTITAVIGTGVLALPNAMAGLGWPSGIICFLAFGWVSWYTAHLLADLYIIEGRRQRTYTGMVRTVFGLRGEITMAVLQHSNLVLTALVYAITGVTAIRFLATDYCTYHGYQTCQDKFWFWGVMFGILQLVLSQLPTLDYVAYISYVGAACSFGYATIALVLNCVYIPRNIDAANAAGVPPDHGSAAGLTDFASVADHTWNVLNSMGAILFAYSWNMILLEITDTVKDQGRTGPIKPAKRAVDLAVSLMFPFYMAVATTGYASFGNSVVYNILTGYTSGPRWAVILGNTLVLVHMIPAFQVWSQPFFEFLDIHVERSKRFPAALGGGGRLWLFRLWFRSAYVVIVTFFAILLPWFGIILGFVGAVGFWPCSVFFPIECWIKVFKPQASMKTWLRVLNVVCFLTTLLTVVGSVALIIQSASTLTPFSS